MMKNSQKHPENMQHEPRKSTGNINRPQNKDDLDSRKGEEQLIKNDDTTHNKKEKKSEGKK